MSAQQVMLVVLVALVMLFVVTIGLGGGHPKGDTGKGPVAFLEGLQSQRFLAIGDGASTTCGRSGANLLVTGGCTVTVADRGRFKPPTRVAFRPSATIGVRLKPKHGPEQTATVHADQCFQSAVAGDGGVLVLGPATDQVILHLTDHPGDDCPDGDG